MLYEVITSHYYESDGNSVALLNLEFDNDESFGVIIATGISTPNGFDQITVGESTAYPYTVTAILGNDDNGIDENSVTTINGSSSSSRITSYNVCYTKLLRYLASLARILLAMGGLKQEVPC